MTGELRVEATGETVGEAKWQALRELERRSPGLDKARVRFQVVSEGERGLLGVGYTPARVVATAEPGAAAPRPVGGDESEAAAAVRELLERITEALGVRCRIEIEEEDDRLTASCSNGNLGLLIGKHGQTIDAIQDLANAIASRLDPERRWNVTVDAAGYRRRREAMLSALALRSAERALTTRSPVQLDPMTAAERKIVHLQLKEVPGVVTTSEGTEPNRCVVITPAGD